MSESQQPQLWGMGTTMDSDRVREGLCRSDDHIGDCLGDSLRIVDRVALDSLSTIRLRVEIVPVSPLLTEDEAISYLRLDTINIGDPAGTLRRYREQGLLKGTQVSKRVFYLREELDAFLRRQTQNNPR